jgi:hypothetical protein
MIVAESKVCPDYLLERLSKDEYKAVRYAVLKNPNCPQSIKESINTTPFNVCYGSN